MSGYDNGFESCKGDTSNKNCDSSYPDVCIASPPPDLNCGDVSYKNIKVEGSDPHGFDRDADGIGCES
jgi:micrococcal nuclease